MDDLSAELHGQHAMAAWKAAHEATSNDSSTVCYSISGQT